MPLDRLLDSESAHALVHPIEAGVVEAIGIVAISRTLPMAMTDMAAEEPITANEARRVVVVAALALLMVSPQLRDGLKSIPVCHRATFVS
jgi:hypothetical protein